MNGPLKRISKEEFLSKYPIELLWRFFVDGLEQLLGWKTFEDKEPGYLVATHKAFFQECCTTNFEQPFSAAVLKRIHYAALTDVIKTRFHSNKSNELKIGEFRKVGVRFGIEIGSNISPDGYRELVKLSKDKKILIYDECVRSTYLDLESNVEKVIKLYHQELAVSATIEDKLRSLIKMVTQLERIHPFADGNCRTICMLSMMRECLKLNLYPPIVDDPNQYDGFSQEELYHKVIKGMERTYEITQFGFTTIAFDRTLLAPKRSSKKQYECCDVKVNLDNITDYKAVFLSQNKFTRNTRANRETFPDDRLNTEHEFLLRSVFFEAWSVVGKKKIFHIDDYQKAFESQFQTYEHKYVKDIERILLKTKKELRPFGHYHDLVRMNCLQTIMKLFDGCSIEPNFYSHLKFRIWIEQRQSMNDFLDQKMVKIFVNLYTSRSDKDLNKFRIKEYWSILDSDFFIRTDSLKSKVSMALAQRGYDIGRFPELNTSLIEETRKKRKPVLVINETSAEDKETKKITKRPKLL